MVKICSVSTATSGGALPLSLFDRRALILQVYLAVVVSRSATTGWTRRISIGSPRSSSNAGFLGLGRFTSLLPAPRLAAKASVLFRRSPRLGRPARPKQRPYWPSARAP